MDDRGDVEAEQVNGGDTPRVYPSKGLPPGAQPASDHQQGDVRTPVHRMGEPRTSSSSPRRAGTSGGRAVFAGASTAAAATSNSPAGSAGGMTSPRRATSRSPTATGVRGFGDKYIPFAAGFGAMAESAPVYRSSRLHAVNPTAAINEDMSYLYTLDSGRTTAAAQAANPETEREHVRNTAMASAGGSSGMVRKLMKPIR